MNSLTLMSVSCTKVFPRMSFLTKKPTNKHTHTNKRTLRLKLAVQACATRRKTFTVEKKNNPEWCQRYKSTSSGRFCPSVFSNLKPLSLTLNDCHQQNLWESQNKFYKISILINCVIFFINWVDWPYELVKRNQAAHRKTVWTPNITFLSERLKDRWRRM